MGKDITHIGRKPEREWEEQDKIINTGAALDRARIRRDVLAEARFWIYMAFLVGVLVGIGLMVWLHGGL